MSIFEHGQNDPQSAEEIGAPKKNSRFEFLFRGRNRDKYAAHVRTQEQITPGPSATQETLVTPAIDISSEATLLTEEGSFPHTEVARSDSESKLSLILNSPYVSEKTKKRLGILRRSIDDEATPKDAAKLHKEAFDRLLEAATVERSEKRQKFSGVATKKKENKDGSPRDNEDTVFNNGSVLLIADGTDGSSSLSELLRDKTISHLVDKNWKTEQDPEIVTEELQRLLSSLQEESTKLSHEKIVNSTMTLVRKFTFKGNEYVGVIHIGDSRAYSHGRNGEVTQLTQDDGILQNLKSEAARALFTAADLAVLDGLSADQISAVQKMIDTCKGIPIDGDPARRDFMDFKGDIPPYLRTVEMFRKLRSSLSKTLGNGELSNDAAIFYKKLENCDGVFVTSDGIHDVLKPDELQSEVNAAVAESRTDGAKIAEIVIEVTEEKRSDLSKVNAFAKNDDKSFGWLASDSEIDAQEFSASRENIQDFSDFIVSLENLPKIEFIGEGGIVVKVEDIVRKVQIFSRQIDTYLAQNILSDPSVNGDAHINTGSLRDFFPLYSAFQDNSVKEFLKKQNFPLGYGILEITARLLTDKFNET